MHILDLLDAVISQTFSSLVLVKYFAAFLTPRFKSKAATLTVLGLETLLVQAVTTYVTVTFFMSDGSVLFSFIIFALLFINHLLMSRVLFKKNMWLKIFLTFSFLVINRFCFLISMGITNLFDFVGRYFILYILVRQAALYLSVQSIVKSFLYRRHSFSVTEIMYLIMPCLLGLVFFFILQLNGEVLTDNQNAGIFTGVALIKYLQPLVSVVYLLCLTASVKLFQAIAEKNVEERQRLMLQNQIKDADNIYAEIRGIRHDMKSHLLNIRLLTEKMTVSGSAGDRSALEDYIKKFGKTLDRFDFAFKTGNSVSDIIIHRKYTEAVAAEIAFTSDFNYPARLGADAYDMAVILNNTLENAWEACAAMADGHKFIRLRSYRKGEIFFIEAENSYAGEIKTDGRLGLPVSGKPDGEAHGYGLANIKRCAEKYRGGMEIKLLNKDGVKVFNLTVMIQGR